MMKDKTSESVDVNSVRKALNGMFSSDISGSNKSIKKYITEHSDRPDVCALVGKHGFEAVQKVAKALLDQTRLAGAPAAVPPGPPQSKAVSAPVLEDTQQEVRDHTVNPLLDSVVVASRVDDPVETVPNDRGSSASDNLAMIMDEQSPAKAKLIEDTSSAVCHRLRFLSPISIDLAVQVRILREIQTALEEACFTYCSAHMPSILVTHGWTCSEAVELNNWSKILKSHESRFASAVEELARVGRSFTGVLNSLTSCRHAAVHRLPLSGDKLCEILTDAQIFAAILGCEDLHDKFGKMLRVTTQAIEEMKRRKGSIGARISEMQREYARRRAIIEEEEKAAIRHMMDEDADDQHNVSGTILRAMEMETRQISAPDGVQISKMDTVSDSPV